MLSPLLLHIRTKYDGTVGIEKLGKRFSVVHCTFTFYNLFNLPSALFVMLCFSVHAFVFCTIWCSFNAVGANFCDHKPTYIN